MIRKSGNRFFEKIMRKSILPAAGQDDTDIVEDCGDRRVRLVDGDFDRADLRKPTKNGLRDRASRALQQLVVGVLEGRGRSRHHIGIGDGVGEAVGAGGLGEISREFEVDDEPLPDMFRYMREPARMRELLFHDPESAVARMIFPDNADDERRMKGYQALTVLARLVWERPYDPKLAARLRRVQCPVLLLWGAQDRLIPPSYGEAYRKQLPQAEMKLIPNCGHMPMFERESEFVEAVAQFCR